jgi:GAF domain-containing protein
MTEHSTDASSSAALQDLLLTSEDITGFLSEFTALIAHTLSAGGTEVWCAVTLLRSKGAASVASSSARAQALDEIQLAVGDGPCLTAAREHRVIHVPDTLTDPRWPDYGKAAAAAGIRSALGVPFELGGEAEAGLNVYADQPAVYDETSIAAVQHQVLLASKALRLAVRLAHHRDIEADRAAAMASRTTIDLAVGIIMGQNRCPQHEAFEILKAVSNHRNIKLREIAADLVATVGKGPVATTHFDH